MQRNSTNPLHSASSKILDSLLTTCRNKQVFGCLPSNPQPNSLLFVRWEVASKRPTTGCSWVSLQFVNNILPPTNRSAANQQPKPCKGILGPREEIFAGLCLALFSILTRSIFFKVAADLKRPKNRSKPRGKYSISQALARLTQTIRVGERSHLNVGQPLQFVKKKILYPANRSAANHQSKNLFASRRNLCRTAFLYFPLLGR